MTNEEAIKILKCCIVDKCEDCPLKVENAYACTEHSFAPVFAEVPKDVLLQVLELCQARQWISIKDRLPDKNTQVLVCDIHKGQYTTTYNDKGHWDDECYEYSCGPDIIEYWMPLPEPPEESDPE